MHAKREAPAAPAATHIVEPGTARYFAWLYADRHRRELLLALLDIEREIEGSLRPGLEHEVAHARLAWWREECARFARGSPVHPAPRRLLELAGGNPAGIELQGLVDCVAWDLAAAPCETHAELQLQCVRWADAVTVPFVLCGPGELRGDTAVRGGARAAGAALREIELLLRLAPDARQGRLRLPVDELDRLGVEPRALAAPPWPDALAQHLRARFEALRSACAAAFAPIDPQSGRHLSGIAAWCGVAAGAARRAARALPVPVAERRMERMADGLRAWRAARGALRGSVRVS